MRASTTEGGGLHVVVLHRYAGSWFIVDSSNTVIVSVMVEEKGRQTADKKEGRKPWTLREFGGQTVWDWLHLLSALAIPVVLAAAGLWFTAQQDLKDAPVFGYKPLLVVAALIVAALVVGVRVGACLAISQPAHKQFIPNSFWIHRRCLPS